MAMGLVLYGTLEAGPHKQTAKDTDLCQQGYAATASAV